MNKLQIILLLVVIITGAVWAFFAYRPVKVPPYATVLNNFDLNRYAGKWYEIARFDFKFEKDLKNVTAEYTLLGNGSVQVVNRGFHTKELQWKEAKGKAKPNGSADQSALKVSFFGPFYSGYNVVMMSPEYENALVFGQSTDYMWILSRNKTISEEVKQVFLEKAKAAGFDIDQLVWTVQD